MHNFHPQRSKKVLHVINPDGFQGGSSNLAGELVF